MTAVNDIRAASARFYAALNSMAAGDAVCPWQPNANASHERLAQVQPAPLRQTTA